MGEELKWLIGIGITFMIAAFTAISTALYRTNAAMKAGDDRLHERVNKVREDYVRRDDLDKHLTRLDTKLDRIDSKFEQIVNDQQDMNKAVLAALRNRHN
jgi:septal ring factor EnvC (AmiA/AmiB activator)